MPEGLIGPVTGLTWRNGLLYVTHRTRVSTLNPATGHFRAIINDLPAWGPFQNNRVIFRGGKMYFFVSRQGNAGPVDAEMLEVLVEYNKPDKHEVPCQDVTLTGKNFAFRNVFTADPFDRSCTGCMCRSGSAPLEAR